MIVTMDGDTDDSDSSVSSSFCSQLFTPLFMIWPGINAKGKQQSDLNEGAEPPATTQNHHMDEGEEGTAQVQEEMEPTEGTEQMDARDQEMQDNNSLGTSSSSTTVQSGISWIPGTNSSIENVASNGTSSLAKPKTKKRQVTSVNVIARRRFNAQKNGSGEKKRKAAGPLAKQRRDHNFTRYIFIVLKQVLGNVSITQQAMNCMNCFMNDMFDRIAVEASKVAVLNRKVTITERELQTAVKLIVPDRLGYYANLEGTKALRRFRASVNADIAKKNATILRHH